MESVIVERDYQDAWDLDAMQRTADAIAWCYEQRSVSLVRSFASPDLRRFVCLYRAPDAESVRAVQRTGNFGFERAWSADIIGSDDASVDEVVVIERVLDNSITVAEATAALGSRPHLLSHLSRDGYRLTSIYTTDAPAPAIELPTRIAYERRWAAKRLTKP